MGDTIFDRLHKDKDPQIKCIGIAFTDGTFDTIDNISNCDYTTIYDSDNDSSKQGISVFGDYHAFVNIPNYVPDVYGLIDYYIDEYLKEKEHNTDRYVLIGMLEGLITICRFCGISDKDLGKERLSKICTGGKNDEAGV